MSHDKNVRVRFAPSPTGFLHVGGARTALYNYLLARKHKGEFLLRIEDTDLERSSQEFLKSQMDALKWLGLFWDNEDKEWRQSLRKDEYRKYALQLVKEKKAYFCFLSDEDLQKQKLQQDKKSHQVKSPYRDQVFTEDEAVNKGPFTIRFKVPEKKSYTFFDEVRKTVNFPSEMVGDFVLIRSNGQPVYNFCCTIDDHLMKITHVLRSEEHLSNTLRQLMIYEALDWTPPQWVHLSIILGKDRKKLSKRHGATSCQELKAQGYLPETLNNALSLLGWSHPEGKEVLSLEELIQGFSLKRLQASPAVFDTDKLKWLNGEHLWSSLQVSDQEKLSFALEEKIKPYMKHYENIDLNLEESVQKQFLNLCKTVAKTLKEVCGVYHLLFKTTVDIDMDDHLTKEVLSWPKTKPIIKLWLSCLKEEEHYMKQESFLNLQKEIQKRFEVKGKQLFMPLRLAILGKPQGFELKEVIPYISCHILKEKGNDVLSRL